MWVWPSKELRLQDASEKIARVEQRIATLERLVREREMAMQPTQGLSSVLLAARQYRSVLLTLQESMRLHGFAEGQSQPRS